MKDQTKYCFITLILAFFLIIPIVSFADDSQGLHFGISAIFGAAGESFVHYKAQSGTARRIIYGTVGPVPRKMCHL